MSKFILKVIAFFVIGMIGGIFADQIFWPYFIERPLFYQYRLEQTPIYLTEVREITIQENLALVEAIEKVKKVVVGLRAESPLGKTFEGSGLILTSDGLIVTLAEILPQGWDFSFFVDGKKTAFQVLKRDLKNNLALVKIEKSDLPTIGFADFEKIKLGERVFLVGTIFEKGTPQKIVNEGIIKSFGSDFIKTNIFEKFILAGSPLFNIEGKILGLNTIDREGKVIAIPITKIKDFLGF